MDLSKQAIEAAMNRNWKEAIEINNRILKEDPKNIEALNRLGRACMETGLKTKAAEIYNKVLKLDKFNSIALKNLDLVQKAKVVHTHTKTPHMPIPNFIEEPGATKTVQLVRVGDAKIVSRLRPGEPLVLAVREHCISVLTFNKEHVGRLPDDLNNRLSRFIKGGNKYSVYIKGLEPLKIFIVETYKSPQFADVPSFPITEKLNYAAFTPPELVHDEKPDIAPPEEDIVENPGEIIDIKEDQ